MLCIQHAKPLIEKLLIGRLNGYESEILEGVRISHPGNPNRNSRLQQTENKISSQASPPIVRASTQLSSVQLLSGVAPVTYLFRKIARKDHTCPNRALISLIVVCLLTLPSLAAAQEAAASATEDAKAVEKQALELVDTIAQGIPSLRNSGNRVYLMSAVADLLWTTDEKRARALFEIVKQEMVTAAADFDPSDQQSYNPLEILQQRRRECLDRLARRDPEMALSFLRATRLPPESTNNNRQANETNLELHLAGLLVAKDPEQALRMGRETLRKGVSYPLISLLSQIAAKNKDLAQTLHKEIVDRLRTEDLTKNHGAAGATWNLLNGFQPPQANEDTYRELVEILASLMLSAAPNTATRNSQNYYNQFHSLMPQLEKYAPARVALLRQWFQSAKRTVDPNTRMYQELNELNQRGTVDDMLALASKYGLEFQPQIYQQAAWKAMAGGDANRARQIVSEFVTDPVQRRQMLEQIDNQLIWNSVNESKIAEARQLLNKVKPVEQRVQILVNLATNVANKGDKRQALDLLAEAKTMLDSSPANLGKLTAQLQLAQGYSSIDAQQSVALMQSVVVQMNQLVAAAVVLDGFENRYLQEGEWMKPGVTSLGNLVNSIEQNLGMLALRDAEGARSLSDQLERPEIRLMAQLEIAQALLGRRNANFRSIDRLQSGRFYKRVVQE